MPPSPPEDAPPEAPRSSAEQRLVRALGRAGWGSEPLASSGEAPRPGRARPQRVLHRDPSGPLVVEVKEVPGAARGEALRGALAQVLLQVGHAAQEQRARGLAALSAPALSDAMVADLLEYARRHAPHLGVAFLDARGRFEVHGPGLDDVREDPDERPEPPPLPPAPPPNPFSDLGQWMLKILLAPRVEGALLRAPRPAPQRPAELIEAADVSPSRAYRFLSDLEELGFLERSRRHLRVVRVQELLQEWSRHVPGPIDELPVLLRVPSKEPLAQVARALARRAAEHAGAERGELARASAHAPPRARAALGLFAACEGLGALHARGAPLHVLVESFNPELLEALRVEPADAAYGADLVLRRAAFPEAVFRAAPRVSVAGVDGVPCADALQCWLDVRSHPARGAEQAAYLAQRLGLDGWSA